ncbi:MAG: diguanylate cyclase [Desulfitobacteriaceae bacterium]
MTNQLPELIEKLDQFSLSSVLEALPDGILLLDEMGQVLYVNRKFTDITGYQYQEFIGLSHFQVVSLLLVKSDLEYSVIWSLFQQALNGVPFTAQRTYYHREGYSVPIELFEDPVLDKSGRPSGVMLVIKDLHAHLILKVAETVNSSLKLKEILKNTVQAIVQHVGLFSSAIFILDQKENLLRLTASTILTEDELKNVIFPIGIGAPGLIAQNRQPMYVTNLEEDPLINAYSRPKLGRRSSIGFPLICKGDVVGVIAFDAETIREFSEKEKNLFQVIANQVAIALYNANLFAELEQLSITDGLTGLYNHRYFQEKLKEEFNWSKRYNLKFSLLLLDIDHFKVYNDTFGHPQGDELLKTFSQILRDNVRNFDVICRYGGEEFTVILRDCPEYEAYIIAERIRIACENTRFLGCDFLEGRRVTVSIGISFYPQAQTSADLLSFADRALYEVKRSGRNRVKYYELSTS